MLNGEFFLKKPFILDKKKIIHHFFIKKIR